MDKGVGDALSSDVDDGTGDVHSGGNDEGLGAMRLGISACSSALRRYVGRRSFFGSSRDQSFAGRTCKEVVESVHAR